MKKINVPFVPQTLGTSFKSSDVWFVYQSKKNERWIVYAKNIEATKITSDWYLWMHHTTDKIPDKKDVKHAWQKKHLENKKATY